MNYYDRMDSRQMMGRCSGITHHIKKGDTLYKLSKIYGVSVSDIMRANPDDNIYNLQVGKSVCIPEFPTPELMPPGNPEAEFLYEVGPTDTLNSILEKFNITFEQFADLNPQLMPLPLQAGIGVFVPGEAIRR